jgi:heme oxygenase
MSTPAPRSPRPPRIEASAMLDYQPSSFPDRPSKLLSERLKAETHADHTRAERHPFIAALVGGRADRAGYAGYLGQMLHVHVTLEAALQAVGSRHTALAVVVREHHFREPALRADLATLGAHPERHPLLPATRLFCERIDALASDHSPALLGTLYVLEGSTNGGRYIAPAVRKALALPECAQAGSGTEYLDPYGPQQQGRWGLFKASLDVLTLSPAECDLIAAVASDAFRGLHDIFEDLTHPPHAHHPYTSRHAAGPTVVTEPRMAPGRAAVRDSVSVCIRRPAEKEARTTHQP